MNHTLELNLAWYRRNFRKKYQIIKIVHSVLEKMDTQFPEASCPHATRLLLECLPDTTLMCGTFKNKSMKKPAFHLWIFDMNAKVHIDMTVHQFPVAATSNILFLKSSDTALLEEVGYNVANLAGWNELFEIGPYYKYPLSKINLTYDGKITLEDVYKEITKKIKV